jgi:hypothetical protein
MKNRRMYRYVLLFLAAALVFPLVSAQHQNAVMPGPGWQVLRADWSSGNRWMDVTNQVRILLSGNGMAKVNNTNMGGDPAVGADKVLRIRARNFQVQTREFTFNEGSSIDASQFYNYGGGIGKWQRIRMASNMGRLGLRQSANGRYESRAGLLLGNGMVKINNVNMGGDPVVGADKVLRVSARDMQGQVQQFSYKEGSSIDASQFYNYGGGRLPRKPRLSGESWLSGWGQGDLQIIRAFYGLNNRTNDVTQLMRTMMRTGTHVVQVNNNMGGDPAQGADKVLTIIYRYQGREQTSSVKEGNTPPDSLTLGCPSRIHTQFTLGGVLDVENVASGHGNLLGGNYEKNVQDSWHIFDNRRVRARNANMGELWSRYAIKQHEREGRSE